MTRFLLMLAAMIAADAVFCWSSYHRLGNFPKARLWRAMLAAFMLLQLSYVLSIFVGSIIHHVPNLRPMIWPIAVYVWHLLILPIAILELVITRTAGAIFRLARLVRWASARIQTPDAGSEVLRRAGSEPGTSGSSEYLRTGIVSKSPNHETASSPKPSFTRRQALAGAAAMLPPIASIAITGRSTFEIQHFRIRRVELHLPTLPPDLDGLTIAHVADLHIGKFLPSGMAERVADATNALDADFIAFAGDLIDISGPRVSDGINFIQRLHPRSGLVMIEGNHDVMVDVDHFEGEVLSAGLPLLLDESKTFTAPGRKTPIQFLGISWGQFHNGIDLGRTGEEANRRYRMPSDAARAASVQAVASQRQPGAFPILLAHHPHAFDHAVQANLPLTLSGHTHGGQIMLTKNLGAGPLRYKYWTGLYEKSASKLFVSNGIGNWFPLRINAPAEIVHLTLRSAPSA